MTTIGGHHFGRGLENNCITIQGKKILIHSFNKDGSGLYRSEENTAGGSEEYKFNVKQSDMAIMAKFETLEVKKAGGTIKCEGNGGKFSFQDIVELHEVNPNLKTLSDTGVALNVFKKAALYSGKDGTVVFMKNGVCTYCKEAEFFYKANCDVHTEERYTVPSAVMKLIEKDLEYGIYSDSGRKLIVLQKVGEIVYMPLLSNLNAGIQEGFNPQAGGFVIIKDVKELKEHLKYALAFSGIVRLTVGSNTLTVSSVILGDDPRIYTADIAVDTNIAAYSQAFSVNGINRILTVPDDINEAGQMIQLSNKLMRIDTDREFAVVAAVKTFDDVDMELKGDAK